jgi:hypothetical protein
MPTTTDRETLRRCRDDIAVFARHLVGEPLWKHQLKLAKDPARIRVVCSGRQAGKSRTLAMLAVHEAFGRPDRKVLIISAGQASADDLLAEVVALTSSPLLAGSVVDELASRVTLSNGSTIRSVPASERQVRGKSIDLLIIDEATLVDGAIWTAARFTVIARPGSRVVMSATPWGRPDGFFATAYRAGERGEEGYSAHHWPSTASPLVDRTLLEMYRSTMTDREYRAEVLAEWVDSAGAFFTPEELSAAVELGDGFEPSNGAHRLEVDLGLDWGFAHDSSAVVGVGPVPEGVPFAGEGRLWVPVVGEWPSTSYETVISELVGLITQLRVRFVMSELNGVGQMPTEVLRRRVEEARRRFLPGRFVCREVRGVHTDARTKENNFGAAKFLLGEGRLALPLHPALLRQLDALEYETTESGSMRIAVPERRGHDDLAMALCQALGPSVDAVRQWRPQAAATRYRLAPSRR